MLGVLDPRYLSNVAAMGAVAGPAYDAASTAYFAAMSTPPTTGRKTLIDALIVGLKADGVWAQADLLALPAAETAQAGLINAVNPAQSCTVAGTMTFTADRGYAGDGSSGYISTVTNDNAWSKFSQNSMSFGCWLNVNATIALVMGQVTGTTLRVAVAAASWATSGAGQAIYFSEEMHAPASVGRLVIAIVMMTILFEFVPVLGIVIGTEHLPSVFSSDAPFTAFLAERASPLIATLVTIGVIAALFNALVSGITCYGRFLYSSGRDRIWSAPINRALVRIHARFGSPWIATLVVALSAVACCFLGLSRLIVLASGCGIAQWVLLNMAGIVGRRRGLTGGPGTYRAPLFPLTHIISLIGAATLAIIAWQDVASGRPGVIAVATVILLSLLYHRFVLDRRGARWTMVSAAADATA